MDIFLIFPIHLFSNINELKNKKIYLIEEPRFFIDFKYHKLKLAYHRASMKSYYNYLISNKLDVEYINFKDVTNKFYKDLVKKNISMYDPSDYILKNKIKKLINNIIIINTLNFLVNEKLLNENIDKFYNGKKYNHQNFYKWQRIRLDILIDNDKPIGGKWSYDEENRKKLPKDINIPSVNHLIKNDNKIINEAKEYILKHFSDNYGSIDNFIYPITHDDSKKWLINFLKNKFNDFGKYEDAESMKDPFLFHSVLTPMMNIGLLTDNEVLDITLKYQNKVPIQSFEGFIRQIIGWRNYMYSIYILEGTNLRKMNFFNHNNKLNKEKMWLGNTGLLPVDNIIKKINNYSYSHHIERLMYLGNYMLLCMIDPNDIYEIFMEWTIDAYDWVMIPNVYSMSQYADGGLIMTKPYFSSSNYILKMSDYKKEEWCILWDALYYNFINVHQTCLSKNYGTSRQVAHWKKKSDKEKNNIIKLASEYLNKVN
jgi:deoxyribodipyrimidine photolyase-related protein